MLPLSGIHCLQIYVCESLQAFLVCVASNPVTVNTSCQLNRNHGEEAENWNISCSNKERCSCAKAELAANSKQFIVTILNTCISSSGFYVHVYTVLRCTYVYTHDNHHRSSPEEVGHTSSVT